MAEPQFRRLHPATVALEFLRVLGRLAWGIVILVVLTLSRQGADRLDVLVTVLGIFAVASALVRYLTFRFAVHDGRLLVHSGLLVRNQRTIPLDRIQHIAVSRDPLHRLMGLVKLRVETASGTGAEADLDALSEADAETLQAELTGRAIQYASVRPIWEREPDSAYRASPGQLVLLGATGNRLLALVGSVMGMAVLLGAQERWLEAVMGWLRATRPLQLAALAAAVLAFGWGASIVTTMVRFWGFAVRLRGSRLFVSYGLLNHQERSIELGRVQVVEAGQSLGQRLLRFWTVSVHTAGGQIRAEDGAEAGAVVLAPAVGDPRLGEIVRLAIPDCSVEGACWERIPARSILRVLQARLLVSAAAGAGVSLGLGPVGWLVAPAALILFGAGAWLRYRTLRYADAGEWVGVRSGWLGRSLSVMPVGKLQTVTIRQSPSQRAHGLADVELSYAGGGVTGFTSRVPDLRLETAFALGEGLYERSTVLGADRADGL